MVTRGSHQTRKKLVGTSRLTQRQQQQQQYPIRILTWIAAAALYQWPTATTFYIPYHSNNDILNMVLRQHVKILLTSNSGKTDASAASQQPAMNAKAPLQLTKTKKEEDNDDYGNDLNARSMFGTKAYWDEVYCGRGDFPADTYSWYTNWNELQQYIKPYMSTTRPLRLFIPGIGNESLLIDMISAGYHQHHKLVVQDYSHFAIERQMELLQSIGCSNYWYCQKEADHTLPESTGDASEADDSTISVKGIELHCGDITKRLPTAWHQSFDIIIEKGLLDAVYLSDDNHQNLHAATQNLHQCLNTNGILISISSVIPNELRRQCFPTLDRNMTCGWEWIRDGSTDAKKAGCFILRRIQ